MAAPELREALIRAAIAMLAPLVRQMIAAGVRFGDVERELRASFVRIADEEEFRIAAKEQTHSRIALLTGINRAEVRRLRSLRAPRPAPRSFRRDVATDLVNRWRTRHTDRAGRPLPLPYKAKRRASFSSIAREVSNDLRPRLLLEGLIASGVVELHDGKQVVLRREAYVPTREHGAKLQMLAEDPPELVATMLHNILAGSAPRLQRKVAYDNLGSDAAETIRTGLRRRGERFMRQVNRWLVRFDRDNHAEAPGGDRLYAGLGVYYFEGPAPPAPPKRTSSRSTKERKK